MRLSREDLALQRRPRMFTLVRVQRPHPSFFGDNYYLRDEISLYFLGENRLKIQRAMEHARTYIEYTSTSAQQQMRTTPSNAPKRARPRRALAFPRGTTDMSCRLN